MSFSSYFIRKFLRSPREALHVIRVSEELSKYITWKLVQILEEHGILDSLQEKPWWEHADKDLAKYVIDLLVEEGYAKWVGDRMKLVSKPERPHVTTLEASDLIPAIDYALSNLPRALETGEKPSLTEARAPYAKLLGNLAYRLTIEIAVEETGLNRLPETAKIVDVLPRIGTSTVALLEMTRAHVIAAEPHPENISVIERTVRLMGQQPRVTFVRYLPEELKLQEKVDAAFMADILHWVFNPRLALSTVRDCLKNGGFLAILQSVYSSAGLVTCLPDYLLGAYRPPPRSSELRELLEESGFRVKKWLESSGVVVARAEIR